VGWRVVAGVAEAAEEEATWVMVMGIWRGEVLRVVAGVVRGGNVAGSTEVGPASAARVEGLAAVAAREMARQAVAAAWAGTMAAAARAAGRR